MEGERVKIVTKKQALKTALWSGTIIAAAVFFITGIPAWIVAGVSTFIVGYFGMISGK